MYIEYDRVCADIYILNTSYGNLLRQIIGAEEDILNKLKAVNRDNKINSILNDEYIYEHTYASGLLLKKGIYFSLRAASNFSSIRTNKPNVKITKFFTFDVVINKNK